MKCVPPLVRSLLACACGLPAPAAMALEIRSDSAATHERLQNYPGAPVYARTPRINPAFSPAAGLLSGIGWPAHPTDWTRQMALISPRHFVCATHYPPGPDWRIAFLSTDGKQHTYRIQSQSPVVNPQGKNTDLLLCTLTAAVPTSLGITPFAVLNLPAEADYRGKEMLVCGKMAKSSHMQLHGFTNLVKDPGFDTTRFAYFDYRKNSGGANDCNYQGGDSGSPAFIMIKGQPALIGTASGQDPLPDKISRNYINFIPAYLTELDSLMEARGYHVKRLYPAATTLSSHTTANAPLLPLKPARVTVSTHNTGTETAHNLLLKLTFSIAPGTVTGRGWICEAASPRVWNCRRGGLDAAAKSTITASWESLPDKESLHVAAVTSYDGGARETLNTTLPITGRHPASPGGRRDLTE